MTVAQINTTFAYHTPTQGQIARYYKIRSKAKELAHVIEECGCPSREQSLAFTSLQQVVMWVNASIACNEPSADTAVG